MTLLVNRIVSEAHEGFSAILEASQRMLAVIIDIRDNLLPYDPVLAAHQVVLVIKASHAMISGARIADIDVPSMTALEAVPDDPPDPLSLTDTMVALLGDFNTELTN